MYLIIVLLQTVVQHAISDKCIYVSNFCEIQQILTFAIIRLSQLKPVLQYSSFGSLFPTAVPPPNVVLTLFPNDEHLYTTTQLNMICSVSIDDAVVDLTPTQSGEPSTMMLPEVMIVLV